MKRIVLFIIASCSARVDHELRDFEACTIVELPEQTALDIIQANRGRIATEADRKRVAEAKAAAEAAAKKAADEAEAAAKKAAADAKKDKAPA